MNHRPQPMMPDASYEQARSAAGALAYWNIKRDELTGEIKGDEVALFALDRAASALIDWKGLPIPTAAPLDLILAELDAPDELIEATARFTALVGRAAYAGGLSDEEIEEAEALREDVASQLDAFLTELQPEDSNA